MQPWPWEEWDKLPNRFVSGILYVTNILNEVEARRNGVPVQGDDDPGDGMEHDLAGLSEVDANG